MNLLSKLLEKRGIKDPSELNEEERIYFDQWKAILSKESLTLEDIKEFCQTQIDIIESKWADYNLDEYKKGELIPYHTVYRTLLSVIDAPQKARAEVERQLNELINK